MKTKPSQPSTHDKDEAKSAIVALASCLLEITDLSARSVVPPATVSTSPDCGNELDLYDASSPSQAIPRKLGPHAPDLLPNDTPLNDKLRDRVKLANLGWDCTAESLHLPALTKNGEWVYCSPD